MIVTAWEGVSPNGEIYIDQYIPISLRFPQNSIPSRRFSCSYRNQCIDASSSEGNNSTLHAMLEIVVDYESGRLCRVVLEHVSCARYRDVDPEPITAGDPIFAVERTRGESLTQRNRVNKGRDTSPWIAQYERFEVWLGNRRLTILFENRVTDTAIQVGERLIVFVDKDREVCGFQFTNITEEEWERIIDTIKSRGALIDA